jgi:hypothetical protein
MSVKKKKVSSPEGKELSLEDKQRNTKLRFAFSVFCGGHGCG